MAIGFISLGQERGGVGKKRRGIWLGEIEQKVYYEVANLMTSTKQGQKPQWVRITGVKVGDKNRVPE